MAQLQIQSEDKPMINLSTGELENYSASGVLIPRFHEINKRSAQAALFEENNPLKVRLHDPKDNSHYRASFLPTICHKNEVAAYRVITKAGEMKEFFMMDGRLEMMPVCPKTGRSQTILVAPFKTVQLNDPIRNDARLFFAKVRDADPTEYTGTPAVPQDTYHGIFLII